MNPSSHTQTHICICNFPPGLLTDNSLSHVSLCYPFCVDSGFHYIQKLTEVVPEEKRAWPTFIYYVPGTLDSWTLITTGRVYVLISKEHMRTLKLREAGWLQCSHSCQCIWKWLQSLYSSYYISLPPNSVHPVLVCPTLRNNQHLLAKH